VLTCAHVELFTFGSYTMKKAILSFCILLSFFFIAELKGSSQLKINAIDTIKITSSDIPEGFMYGKVPAPYQSTLKDNPWMMDRAAIKRLADKIYPGGDFNKIAGIHVSIITKKKTPLGDDIVCYMILYNNMKAAQDEMKKMNEFVGYNRDRALVLAKDNLAIILFVDDIENYHYIQELAKMIEERMKNI
jgi:hypothetical protein